MITTTTTQSLQRTFATILVMAIVLIGCGGTARPPQPQPIPPPVTCQPPEVERFGACVCEPPAVIKAGVCVLPDEPEPEPEPVPPAKAKHVGVEVIYGPLPFVMTQEKLDAVALGDLLVRHSYDGIHFHLNSPYCRNKAENFWYFGPNKEKWKARYRVFAEEMAKRDLIQIKTMYDQYGRDNGAPFPLNLDAEALYESWNRVNICNTNDRQYQIRQFATVAWYCNDAIPPSKYDCVSPACRAIEEQMRFVFETDAAIQKKYPTAKFIYTQFNEQHCENPSSDPTGGRPKCRGGEDKNLHWMRWLMTDSGLKLGANVRTAVNFMNYKDNVRAFLLVGGQSTLHPVMQKNALGILRHSMWEVHSIEGAKEVALIRSLVGNLNNVILSTDGTDDSPIDRTGGRPNGVGDAIAAMNGVGYFVVKAGKAGKQFESLVFNQDKFFAATIPVTEKLLPDKELRKTD